MRVKREDFIHALESVQPGLASKEILEQSCCFVFDKGKIVTFNDNVACRIASPLGKSVTGAVQASKLIELLTKLPEEEIDVEAVKGELIITGKRRKAGIRMEAEVHLPVDQIETPKEFTELNPDFLDALSLVQECAGLDESRFHLTCIHIHPNWIEACDSIQLNRYKMKTKVKDPVLVRRDSIKHIISAGVNEFSETPTWIHFKSPTGLVLSCRRFTDVSDYPDLTEHLNVEGKKIKLPKALVSAVETAELFSQENVEHNHVKIDLIPGKLRIKGEGSSGWFTEVKGVEYDGEPMCFEVSPKLLTQLVNRFEECTLSKDRLMVDGGKYRYVACLQAAGEKVEKPKKKAVVAKDEEE